MFKYGNLRYTEKTGWVFIETTEVKELEVESLIKALNIVGKQGWELIELDSTVGYLFKKEVKNSE